MLQLSVGIGVRREMTHTIDASCAAMRSIGMIIITKIKERTANAFAARVYVLLAWQTVAIESSYHDPVIPSKDGEFVKSSDKIPTRCNITRNEDAKCKDRESMHMKRRSMWRLCHVYLIEQIRLPRLINTSHHWFQATQGSRCCTT